MLRLLLPCLAVTPILPGFAQPFYLPGRPARPHWSDSAPA